MPLFEVALLQLPSENEKKEGKLEKLLMNPTPVVATDAQTAGAKAIRQAKDLPEDIDNIKVLVRPFA
jgi:hypothetical protein